MAHGPLVLVVHPLEEITLGLGVRTVTLPPGTHKELLVLSGTLSSSRSSSFPRNKDRCDGQISRFPLKNLEYVYFKFYKRFNAQIDKNLNVNFRTEQYALL